MAACVCAMCVCVGQVEALQKEVARLQGVISDASDPATNASCQALEVRDGWTCKRRQPATQRCPRMDLHAACWWS